MQPAACKGLTCDAANGAPLRCFTISHYSHWLPSNPRGSRELKANENCVSRANDPRYSSDQRSTATLSALSKQVVKARIRKTMSHRVNYALRGKRFVVRSDEKLIAFLELERITHESALSALLGDDTH